MAISASDHQERLQPIAAGVDEGQWFDLPHRGAPRPRRLKPPRQNLGLIAAISLLAAMECAALRPGEARAAEMAPAPVTTCKLVAREFGREARLTGSVGLYRQEEVGFEVGGRVESVLDLGKEVEGPVYDEAGQIVRKGDVVAGLDATSVGCTRISTRAPQTCPWRPTSSPCRGLIFGASLPSTIVAALKSADQLKEMHRYRPPDDPGLEEARKLPFLC
jgi:hypothetical protein